jgi:hypothetical protein
MATEEQKKARLLNVFNITIYGLIKGLWDLFGESSFATVQSVGNRVLTTMEKESGLEIHGENQEDILQEIVRLLTDEVGTMSNGDVMIEGKDVSIACQECVLRKATRWLEDDGIQPFACLPMNVATAAMRKRLGAKHRLLGREWDAQTQTCTIKFELFE